MSTERLQAATALLRQFVADRKIAGAVAAVARRGKIVYLEPVGLQSLEIEGADDGAVAVPRLFDDQGGDLRRGADARGREQAAVDRSGLEVPARIQAGDGAGRRQRRPAPAPRATSRFRICCSTPRASAIARRSCIADCRCARARSACRSSSSTSRRRRCSKIRARAFATAKPRRCWAASSRSSPGRASTRSCHAHPAAARHDRHVVLGRRRCARAARRRSINEPRTGRWRRSKWKKCRSPRSRR